MRLLAPLDAAAPPEDTWGPMLVVALVVVAVVAMVVGFGRITRGRRSDGEVAGRGGGSGRTEEAGGKGGTRGTGGASAGSRADATTSDDELPTDPA